AMTVMKARIMVGSRWPRDAMNTTRAASVSHCKASKLHHMLMRSATAMLVLLAAMGVAVEACAQYPGGQGGAGGTGGARGGMGAGRGGPPPEPVRRESAQETPRSPGALVQIQLDQLEDDLKLSPAQIGAWRIYADKVQKLADETARSRLDARLSTPAPTSAV